MRYNEIIDLPHYEPKRHPRMPMESRAAQFAPFAALEGHEDALLETERLTSPRHILSQDEKIELSRTMTVLAAGKCRNVRMIFFVPDNKKDGGTHREVRGKIKKLDMASRQIFLEGGIVVDFERITDLEILS